MRQAPGPVACGGLMQAMLPLARHGCGGDGGDVMRDGPRVSSVTTPLGVRAAP
ncbi:hypothetical protein [Streptomyces sp. Inha503]|uniref:hypothetical protein n=1 Tax=Streptomyces sp. Inha503 TaxID=3383314 RepID=UPI0039A00824